MIDQEGADTFLPKLAELFEFVGTCAAADGFGHDVAHLWCEGLECGVEADGNGFAGIAAAERECAVDFACTKGQ